jgi:organic radical activating enzyme
MEEKSVKLIENFQSYQGEGPDMGQAMIILRFKTCNLKCPWCDTSVKMRISAEAPHKLSDIQQVINDTRSGLLITGGEPTVPKHIDDAVMLLTELDYPIANVESNGYDLETLIDRIPSDKNIHFMFSPKIFSEKDYDWAVDKANILLDMEDVYFKIVYERTILTVDFCAWLSSKLTLSDSHRIWLMPEGTTRADLIRNSADVFDACEKYRFNFSSRSHVIYGFV